jgi:hypothetical protein
MRRLFLLSTLVIAAGVVSACSPEDVVDSPVGPTAGVRFINAVPDTGAAFGLDFRFVDIVENSGAFRIPFRNGPQNTVIRAGDTVTASAQIQYKAAKAGSRHFRIFLDDTLQAVASTALKDSTVDLTAAHNYTFLLWGNARSSGSDKMRLTVIDETGRRPRSERGAPRHQRVRFADRCPPLRLDSSGRGDLGERSGVQRLQLRDGCAGPVQVQRPAGGRRHGSVQ